MPRLTSKGVKRAGSGGPRFNLHIRGEPWGIRLPDLFQAFAIKRF